MSYLIRSDSMNCKKCKQYNKCKTLCSEVNEYVNQDYVSRKEGTFTELDINDNNLKEPLENPFGVTTNEILLIYKLYFLDKKPIKDILYHIKYSERSVFNFIKKLKVNIDKENGDRKKEILKLHLIDGKREGEIAESIKLDPAYIHRVVLSYLEKNFNKLT